MSFKVDYSQSLSRTRRVVTIPDECHYDDYSSDEEDFYYNYEPFNPEEEFVDNGEYEPFNPEEEEKEHQAYISPILTKTIKPTRYWNSPTKKEEQKKLSPVSTWWDKPEAIPETKRVINGVLNYAALLPPKLKNVGSSQTQSKKKNKKAPVTKKQRRNDGEQVQQRKPEKRVHQVVASSSTGLRPVGKGEGVEPTQQKPTRFCLSVIKGAKCLHSLCRFAHSYAELKECKFGDNCNKISLLKTNQDGTIELNNKNSACCTFKHPKESKHSYLKRVPQQHTSPKK